MVMAAAAVITRFFTLRHLIFTQRIKAFFGAIAFIRCTRDQHLINHGVVAVKTFGLEIRAFVPLQIEPVHTIHNGFNCFRRGALEIGVFNTQYELTFVVACKKPGIESGTCTTDVQIACRARREASFDFHEMALRYKDAGNRQILGKKQWAIFYHCGGIPQC